MSKNGFLLNHFWKNVEVIAIIKYFQEVFKMARNKNLQDKNTVSGNKAESNMSNCGKNENSTKNRTSNSSKNTESKYTAKKDMDEEEY